MPIRRLVALFVLALAPALASAQSGLGTLRGIVLPIRAGNVGGFGDWNRSLDGVAPDGPQSIRDTVRVATLTLTPIATLRDRTHATGARGMYGRYAFGRLSMGRYRLRVEAPGCTPVEADVVILSDSESVQHVALACAWAND